MIDALGNPQSVLVLGATSDIATACVRRFERSGRLERVVLVGRDPDALSVEAARLRSAGVAEVATLEVDARDADATAAAVRAAFAEGDVDVALLAFGVLPDQAEALADPAVAVQSMQVNYLGSGAAALAAAHELSRQGHGTLVVLSSVAGERPRRANFVYGSAKAGLDALSTGLGEQLRGSGASVLVVRPGFVRSKMTAGMRPAPMAVTPDDVAEAVAANLTRGSRTVWVPVPMRAVMTVLRHLPAPLFRRLPV